jgi:hypothetical protein
MIEILGNPNAELVRKWISKDLVNNLTKDTCLALANLITIDYKIRLDLEPDIKDHIKSCLDKLRQFLGQKVITDNSFSVALMLFTVAISPTPVKYDTKENILNKSEDVLIETLVNTNFGSVNLEERNILKVILRELLKSRNSQEIMNVIKYEPELFRTTVLYAIKKYRTPADIITNIKSELSKIVSVAVKHYKKIETFKQATSKILTAVCSIALGAISIVTAGAAFALTVLPAGVLAVSYAPVIGERLGEMILNADKFMINEEKKIALLRTNIRKNYNEFSAIQQSVQLQTTNENVLTKKQEIDISLETKLLTEIKKQFGDRVSQDNRHKTGKNHSQSQDHNRHR